MARNYSDTVPQTTLQGAASGSGGVTSGDTSFVLGVSLAPYITAPFVLRVEPGTVNEELVLVTAGAGTIGSPYTVTRGFGNGTAASTKTAVSHAQGVPVTHGVGAEDLGRAYYASVFYNVMAYGAKGDGATNDSAAIQAAQDAAVAAGGGTVFFPAGTYRCNVLVDSKVVFRGAGTRATTLKAVAGSNAAVIQGRNFATLTGKSYAVGDINLGSNYFGLMDLTLDGAKSANTGAWVIRIWGHSHYWNRVYVQNGSAGGIWTEFTTHDAGSVDDLLEANFMAVKTVGNSGDGWRYRGPHDSYITNYVTVSNSGWGFKSETSAGSYTGQVNGNNWNSWLNTTGSFYFGGSPGKMMGMIASGVGGTGIELAAGVGSGAFTGVQIAGHTTGLILRGIDHSFHAMELGSMTTGIQLDGCGTCVLDFTHISIGTLISITGTGETNPNKFRGVGTLTTTLVAGGTLHFADTVDIYTGGGAAGSYSQYQNATFTAGGYTLTYPGANGTISLINNPETVSNKTWNDTNVFSGNVNVNTVGKGLKVKEGSNAMMGSAALVGGSKVVATTAVTASSRIFVLSNADGGTPGWLRVSARTAGTSFTITSSSGTDTSTVAWMIVEPA